MKNYHFDLFASRRGAKLSDKKFKVDDRVWHRNMGYGTVTRATYYNMHGTTYTCAVFDDFLDMKNSMCCETEELILANEHIN